MIDKKYNEVSEKIKRLTYSQDWTSYNEAQTKEKTISEKLIIELMNSIPDKEIYTKKGGRPWTPLRDRIFIMFLYCHAGYSSRRTISELNAAKERGLIEKIPHFNSILNFFHNKSVTPMLLKLIWITALPLRNIETDIAIDSSGFSTSRFQQWFNVRTGKDSKKRHWKKAHLSVGVKTNIIISMHITDGTSADCPELISLTKQSAKNFDVKEVSADKAYLSKENFECIAELGAIPYVPFKSNSRRNSRGSPIWSRMFDYFLQNRDHFDKCYHKRSNVETAFHMIKRKFGQTLRTKKDNSQVNEILMKCLCHNLAILVHESIELGLEIDLVCCTKTILAQEQK